jgi:hypothetical protein
MATLDDKEVARLRALDADAKDAETIVQIQRIQTAVHAGTHDVASIDDACARLTELHVKPEDENRLGGRDKTAKPEAPAAAPATPGFFSTPQPAPQPHP